MIEYRKTSEEDKAQIARLETILFSDPWSEEPLSQFLSSPFAKGYVGICQEKVVCYALCTHIAGEGEVLRIGTLPEYRRQGMAKKLLSLYFEDAKQEGANTLFLEVREQNLAARRLYEAIGFEQIGTRKHYYSNPKEDAVLYQIQLNKEPN